MLRPPKYHTYEGWVGRVETLIIYHGFVVDFSVPFLVTMWCVVGW